MEGICRYESLYDGAVFGLCDIADMNDALDRKYENQARVQEAMRGK